MKAAVSAFERMSVELPDVMSACFRISMCIAAIRANYLPSQQALTSTKRSAARWLDSINSRLRSAAELLGSSYEACEMGSGALALLNLNDPRMAELERSMVLKRAPTEACCPGSVDADR